MTATTYWTAMLWRSSWFIYGSVFLIAVLVVLARTALAGPWLYIAIGIVIGVILREFLYHRQTIKIWPVIDEIIDWHKVDVLVRW